MSIATDTTCCWIHFPSHPPFPIYPWNFHHLHTINTTDTTIIPIYIKYFQATPCHVTVSVSLCLYCCLNPHSTLPILLFYPPLQWIFTCDAPHHCIYLLSTPQPYIYPWHSPRLNYLSTNTINIVPDLFHTTFSVYLWLYFHIHLHDITTISNHIRHFCHIQKP